MSLRSAALGFLVAGLAASTAQARTICTAIADAGTGKILMQQGDCSGRVTPASTFKIAISLMGYDSGFLKDALRYYMLAHESDPIDAAVALKLGWTNNLLHDDQAALNWFAIAKRSSARAMRNRSRCCSMNSALCDVTIWRACAN